MMSGPILIVSPIRRVSTNISSLLACLEKTIIAARSRLYSVSDLRHLVWTGPMSVSRRRESALTIVSFILNYAFFLREHTRLRVAWLVDRGQVIRVLRQCGSRAAYPQ